MLFLLFIQCPAHGPPGRAGPFACAQSVNELAPGPAQGLCCAPTANAVEIPLRHNSAQFNFVEGGGNECSDLSFMSALMFFLYQS